MRATERTAEEVPVRIPCIPYRTGDSPERLAAVCARGDSASAAIRASVSTVLEAVRTRGDAAVVEYTEQFDHVRLSPEEFRVPMGVCEQALEELEPTLAEALRAAHENIRRFHEHHRPASWTVDDGDGVVLGKRYAPVAAAGLYVPGGTAPLFSSVLMSVVPAKVARVPRVALCTPPSSAGLPSPATLAACALAGVDEVYRIGGIQAIAAMAYGTGTVAPVDVIAGPGNAFVQEAKRRLAGTVGIDMVAGPSEIVVIADETANPAWIAADLLSQAEHGSGAEASVAIVTSEGLGERIATEVDTQIRFLPRSAMAEKALNAYGTIFVVPDLQTACELTNRIAPEHVELHTADPWALVDSIRCAGAIFIGENSPEPVGDYYAGTNHILPTGRAARFASSVGVDTFLRATSLVAYTGQRLAKTAAHIVTLAEGEGLSAHARAAAIRVTHT
ncbi:MAG TPA: histidinol dehydrogenase [Candidatus Latescibacteria bacterium]|nr:histidinol dehydrogenase [Candidatus Latescibacterota bacterium]